MRNFKLFFVSLCAVICLTSVFSQYATAQSRDYLTEQEIELVRDANEIDLRINVLVKAIDRRLLVINKDTTQEKQLKKDSDKWGELPTGTKTELLSDISNLLQKAIDDIDDLASRKSMNDKLLQNTTEENETDTETKRLLKTNDKKFPTAVHNLADASRKYLPILQTFENNATDEKERGVILRAIESCNMIIEASAQVQRPETNKKKNKGN